MSGIRLTSTPTTLSGSYSYIYGPSSGTYSFTNLGTVAATGNTFPGAIYLKLGGSVTNGSASVTDATVTGYGTNAGVAIVGAPGTVTNFGTIVGGTAQRGIRLYDGGTVVNGSPTDTLAVIRANGLYSAVGIAGTTQDIPSGGGGGGGSGIHIPTGSVVTTGSIGDPPAGLVKNYGTIGDPGDRVGVAFGTGAGAATLINGSTADTTALIISGSGTTGTGVYIGGPNGGTIENFATIGSSTARSGIYLGTLSGAVGITNYETGLITGGYTDGSALYSKDPSGRVNVTNFGSIRATAGAVINLVHGGTITNELSGVIQQHGPHSNIYSKYGVSTVVNLGTIGDSIGHAGISFGTPGGSGTVINGSTADTTALIFGGTTSGPDIYFGGANGGTVMNFATIGAPGARDGVDLAGLAGRVSVINGSSTDTAALITGGASTGHALDSTSPTGPIDLLNYGTIAGTAGAAIAVEDGGRFTNGTTLDTSALIRAAGTHAAVYTNGGLTTVVNYGTIGSATGGNGVAFQSPAGFGTIVNGSTLDETALIMGGATLGSAINSSGPTDRLDIANFGTLVATAAAAIFLGDGGSVTNGSAGDTNALIRAPGTHSAIYVQNGVSETIVNFGTIGGTAGNAVAFGTAAGFASVVNGSTADTTALIASGTGAGTGVGMANPNSLLTVANYGTITSVEANGVYLAGGGTVTNGSAYDKVAAIFGSTIHSAISSQKFVAVHNYGTISDPGPLHPVSAGSGALITNGLDDDTTALMSAIGSGIHVQGAALTLKNFGTIANIGSGGSAVYTFGGTITNGSPTDTVATIGVATAGNGIGVYGAQLGPITNFGTVVGGTGILFSSVTGIGTVINAGTIASLSGPTGDAILFNAPGALVVADPGAVFDGLVDASAGGNAVVQLAAGATTGTLDGLGTNFIGFSNTTVDPGANWELTGSNSLAGGTTLSVLGTLTAATSLDGTGSVVLSGGTLLLDAGLSSFMAVAMAGATVNTVAVPGSTDGTFSNLIGSFDLGDRIEVSNVVFNGATQDAQAIELTEDGTTVFTLGNVSYESLTPPNFHTDTDSVTGFDYVTIACFAAGTHLLTASGEVSVEAVRAGMLVPSLAHGRPMRVVWVGHRQVNCAAHPRPHEVWPVRIAAHAVGPDAPHRDLLLSPDHAVVLHDERGGSVLVPARYLVNGATIVQERRDAVGYFHVELESHGVVVAEGLATESYLDTGNRGAFVNGGGAISAHPDFALRVWEKNACAPLVVEGPVLAQARAALVARASALGFALTGEPDLRVVAGGLCVTPTAAGENWFEAVLPANAVDVRLVSRTMVPAEISGSADTRRLGVGVTAITLDDAPVALDDARLLEGWHAAEPELRWTGGEARIALAGQRVLRLRISGLEQYWVPACAATPSVISSRMR